MRLLFLLSVLLFSKPVFAQDCHIFDLTAQVVDCANGQFYVVLNFQHENTGQEGFKVFGNGQSYGNYPYSNVPVTIGPLAANGTTNYEFVVRDLVFQDCQDVVQLGTVSCDDNAPCEIYDLVVETGDCNSDGTFNVWINFQVQNPTDDQFDVLGNGVVLGTFSLSDLPLHITNFPSSGNTGNYVKVCINDNPDCCRIKQFVGPNCSGNACEITNLAVQTGDCNNDGTYKAWVNFSVQNPGNSSFDLWGNGQYIGNFPLSSLPLLIPNFPGDNNGPNDVIKVCINDNPDCCKVLEFPAPNCQGQGNCEIYDLTVETGPCNNDGTYKVKVNFQVQNPGNNSFDLWGNGQYLGNFPLSGLPLTIPNFPGDNNGPNDVIKVCINDNPNCCKVKEFPAPNCNPEPCEIYNIVVETGDCNDDGTYHIWVNFQVDNPTDDQFDVFANSGAYIGTFNLSDLPLHIENFPTDGGATDRVKICINDNPGCCKTKNFEPPACPGDECKIWKLKVQTTPCVCGQFFALLTFRYKNVGTEGFDVMGNGQNYGNFPYSSTQPIVIGPLQGDGTTNYEFVVKDHQNPDCKDDVNLGVVECDDNRTVVRKSTVEAVSLRVSPNPASDRVLISAQNTNGLRIGSATVQVFAADGQLLRTETVADGNVFTLDVATLPVGVYRVRVVSEGGAFAGDFVKQ